MTQPSKILMTMNQFAFYLICLEYRLKKLRKYSFQELEDFLERKCKNLKFNQMTFLTNLKPRELRKKLVKIRRIYIDESTDQEFKEFLNKLTIKQLNILSVIIVGQQKKNVQLRIHERSRVKFRRKSRNEQYINPRDQSSFKLESGGNIGLAIKKVIVMRAVYRNQSGLKEGQKKKYDSYWRSILNKGKLSQYFRFGFKTQKRKLRPIEEQNQSQNRRDI